MPERTAPTPYDEAIAAIVAARQMAFREINAFPQTTPLAHEQRREIIEGLPPLGAENAIPKRLSAAVTYEMNSLDLARIDNRGDWESGANLDREIQDFFDGLREDPALQRQLGVKALSGYIARDSVHARPEVAVMSLGPELDYLNITHVTRMRRVARLAIRNTSELMVVRKRSDFRLGGVHGLPPSLAAQARVLSRPDLMQSRQPGIFDEEDEARIISLVNEVKKSFLMGIETAIRQRPEWLYPINMNHHVKVDHGSPLQIREIG